MKKAFGYVRCSSKANADGDTFERQQGAIREYAKTNGLKVVRYFRDEGVSGTKDSIDRPGFLAMFQALLSNGVKVILIEKLDRLARDLMLQETILSDMKKNGVEIVSTAEPEVSSDDPNRKFIRQVLGAFAEYEKDLIVYRLRAARLRKKAKTGKSVEGRKPFGARPGEERTLERMRQLRADGLGFDRIAATLNAEGYPTRKRGVWRGFAVNQILSRPEAPSRRRNSE